MVFKLDKIMANKQGALYKISKNVDNAFLPIIFSLNNVKLLFNIQRTKQKIYVNWILDKYIDIDKFSSFESCLAEYLSKTVHSNIINKPNYPKYLNTQIKLGVKGSEIICDKESQIQTYEEYIIKNKKYNLILEIKNIFVKKNIINYSIIIKKISIAL